MQVAASAAPRHELGASRKWLITVAVMLGATLEVLDTSIVNVALPHLQGSFSASTDEITWVLTSYIVANGIMIPLTGWISARFGRKRYFLVSVVVFVLASALCGAAQSLGQIVAFRVLQGVAGAAMIPSSQAILMETFPAEEQGLAMAMWGVGLMVAPMLGPTLGGWITDNWSWRWNFYINLPMGALAAVMVMMFVEDPDYLRSARGKRRVDVLGIACLVIGLGLLQIVLDRGQRAEWFAAPWVCAFTAISVVALVVLVVHELRFSEPILDLSILKIPTFNISVAIITVMVLVVYGANLLNPLFFQDLLGYSAWRAGLALVPRGFGTLIAMLAIGQLARFHFDTRWLVGVGFALFSAALWAMSEWTLGVSSREVMLPIFVSGFAGGLIFPTMSASTLACVERERMGYAASLYNMMRNTGSAIGISVVSNLLVSRSQVHQAYLVQHFTDYDAWKLSHPATGMAGAPHWDLAEGLAKHQLQGFGMVYHSIQQQAALMAYNDIYRMLAGIAVVFVPAFLLLRKARANGGAAAH
ncbi:MAG TPA: DHA2 family efflux MFS transporter permease subunit [Myxococcota bacterium]|nr:DHA2 family efflux MFS transporter permease subunit [Myxococcota bacterium]